ncbi:MAG TPA: GTPase HflX [Candidatus Limnocylindria bacterium]|jgi:GTP-binding protein HflX
MSRSTTKTIEVTPPPERAFLVALESSGAERWPVERRLAELGALAMAAGAEVVGSASQKRAHPDPTWYLGKGRAAELADEKAMSGFTLLVVDDELSANQQRNLEQLLDGKVVDRSALILDIFARHARTREGRLQVELAQLEYHLPRLTRMWTHLSRTAGGIGTRGPGESQLETDRRRIREKIHRLRAEIDQVKRHRATAGRRRDRSEVPVVALVGYTNAGKSTLLNALTDADAFVADMPFATLDPTSRRITLDSHRQVVLTDTVGFINKLPHDLVDAFRATLEEVLRADLLLEVVDASDPDFIAQQETVRTVLDELGAGDTPRILVFNKLDRLNGALASAGPQPSDDDVAYVSALAGDGLDGLRERIATALRGRLVAVDAVVPYPRAELLARARSAGEVTERFTDDGVRIVGRLPQSLAGEVHAAALPSSASRNGSGTKPAERR